MHAFATSSDRPVLIKWSVMQQMYFTCFSLLVPALPPLLLLPRLQSLSLFKVLSFSFALVSNRFPLVSSLRPLSVCQSAVCVCERVRGAQGLKNNPGQMIPPLLTIRKTQPRLLEPTSDPRPLTHTSISKYRHLSKNIMLEGSCILIPDSGSPPPGLEVSCCTFGCSPLCSHL